MREQGQFSLFAAIFGLIAISISAASAQELPLTTIPQMSSPPAIDGDIAEPPWQTASGLSLFRSIRNGKLVTSQPVFHVAYDANNLYIAAQIPFAGQAPKTSVRQHDGPVYTDDAIEVFLMPPGDADYSQFVVNAAGIQWDGKCQDATWNPTWQAAASIGTGVWYAELAIPFASLGVSAPSVGQTWRINFAWDNPAASTGTSTWGPAQTTLHNSSSFGKALFAPSTPFHITSADGIGSPTLTISGEVAAAPATIDLQILNTAGKQVATFTKHFPGDARIPLNIELAMPREGEFTVPGQYILTMRTLNSTGATSSSVTAPFEVLPPIGIEIAKYLLVEKTVEVTLDTVGLTEQHKNPSARVSILDSANREVIGQAVPTVISAKSTVQLDVSQLVPGAYSLSVSAFDPGQAVPFATNSESLIIPDTPKWLNSRQGITDRLLPPWTPVRLNGNRISVWGRDYTFDGTPFPSSVKALDRQLLAGPVQIVGIVDGNPITWRDTTTSNTQHTDTFARLDTSARAGGITLTGQVKTEFDGLAISDFSLQAEAPVTIDSLAIEIPVKPEYATYLYHYPGQWGSSFNVGALPANGYEGGFRPYVWLGNEDVGFSWFSETDRNFFINDREHLTQVIRQDERVILRVNMIDHPVQLTEPLGYQFGFQATPVKSNDLDVWDYRICHAGSYNLHKNGTRGQAELIYPAEGNIDLAQGTFECWVRPRFNTNPDIAPDDAGRGAYNRSLVRVMMPSGDEIIFYWNIDDRGMRLGFKHGEQYPVLLTTHTPMPQDSWHHVAFTWGDEAAVYIDGEKVASKPFKGSIPGDLTGATIAFGTRLSEFDIDEIRISDVARTPKDFDRPYESDQHTLLLDHLDTQFTPDGRTRTVPAKASADGGRLDAEGLFVEGRFGNAIGLYTSREPRTELDHIAEAGVRTICFHEHWTPIQASAEIAQPEDLRDLVKACHEKGIKLLLYFGYEISDIHPDWEAYQAECLCFPRRGGYTRKNPDQTAYTVCYRSAWQDYVADGIAKMMDEFDIDGVYLDGTANPWDCHNVHHGCGYTRPDGTAGDSYSILGAREMMQRIYTIVKSRKPDGLVNLHQSTCMTTPSIGFATSYWDGEQFGSMSSGDPLKILPLDAFRAEFMGHQWGIPAELLCYERPYTYSQAMAISLPHDVLVRGRPGPNLRMEARLWDAMDAFGRHQAEWLPYWRNADFISTNTDDCKVSIYSRGQRGAMLIMSNLGPRQRVMKARLQLNKLGLPDNLTAENVMTGEATPINSGEVAFDMEPLTFKVLWIRPK